LRFFLNVPRLRIGKPVGTPPSLYVQSRRIIFQRHHGTKSVYRVVISEQKSFMKCSVKILLLHTLHYFPLFLVLCSLHISRTCRCFFLAIAAFAMCLSFPSHLLSVYAETVCRLHFYQFYSDNLIHIFPGMSLFYYYIKSGD